MKKGSYRKVVSEFGFLSIEVIKMQKKDYISDPRYSDMKTASRSKMLENRKKKTEEQKEK